MSLARIKETLIEIADKMGGCISGLKQNKVAPLMPKEAWMPQPELDLPTEEELNDAALIQEVREYIIAKKAGLMVSSCTQTFWASEEEGNGNDERRANGSASSLIRRMEEEISAGSVDG